MPICFMMKKDHFKQKLLLWPHFSFEDCVCYIFASSFLSLNESTCQTRKNCFYSTSKAFYVLEKIKF